MRAWLTCFPAYGFLLCSPPGRESDCVAAFHARGLDAALVGQIDESGVLALRSADQLATVPRSSPPRRHRPRTADARGEPVEDGFTRALVDRRQCDLHRLVRQPRVGLRLAGTRPAQPFEERDVAQLDVRFPSAGRRGTAAAATAH